METVTQNTRVMQSDLLKLVSAADKMLPTKTALRAAKWLPKERKFVSGEGWRHVETVPSWFQGITLEAHTAGYLSATVHILDGNDIAYVSVPFTVKANVSSAFRMTVYADVLMPLVRLSNKREAMTLAIVDGKLTMTQGRNVDRFNPIALDTYYDQAYAAAMKPAPVVITPILVKAPLMLPAPKIDNELIIICEASWLDTIASIEAQPTLMPGALREDQAAEMRATNPIRAKFLYCDAMVANWIHAQPVEPLAGVVTFDTSEDAHEYIRANWVRGS